MGENTVYYYDAEYSYLIFSLNIGIIQLNLKFEIEVLCKNLALDINELKPGNLPGGSQGRGSLVGCYLWGRTESDTTEAT